MSDNERKPRLYGVYRREADEDVYVLLTGNRTKARAYARLKQRGSNMRYGVRLLNGERRRRGGE